MREIILFVIIFFVVSNLCSAEVVNDFSVDLIHRDSPLSPLFNSSMHQTEALRGAALRSIARSNSFSHNFSILYADTVIIPEGGDYLVKIFIGTPPKESILLADTTSSLVWVQCWPCTDCVKQDLPLFNPTKSVTYHPLSCHTDFCESFGNFTFCGPPADSCSVWQREMGGRYGSNFAELAQDVIRLGSNMTEPVEAIFGCSRQNDGPEFGVVGLNAFSLSLATQLGFVNGRVFSYCLNTPNTNISSKLTFHSQSTLTTEQGVVSTPMLPNQDYYVLSLQGICINNVKIQPILSNTSDMIIDSGSTLTYLQRRFYDAVEAAVVNSIGDAAMRFPPSPYQLCYKEVIRPKVPDVSFHFYGGAPLRFPASNMFLNVDESTTCFMILPHPTLSILGNRAQVNFKVEFDLVGRRVSFAPRDCTKE